MLHAKSFAQWDWLEVEITPTRLPENHACTWHSPMCSRFWLLCLNLHLLWGGDTELSLGSLPVSNITIRSWSEVTLNPLVWNKGENVFLINPVETVHVCRVKTAQSSRKQQPLSVPFSLEQTGIVFPGLFVLERLLPTVRTHDPEPWEDPPAPILSDPGPGAADPTPAGSTHSFLLGCYGLCPGTCTGPFSA